MSDRACIVGIGDTRYVRGEGSGLSYLGLQLQAAPFEEERLLRAARMFEHETDWHTKRAVLSE